jgi:hypothetical protein
MMCQKGRQRRRWPNWLRVLYRWHLHRAETREYRRQLRFEAWGHRSRGGM